MYFLNKVADRGDITRPIEGTGRPIKGTLEIESIFLYYLISDE